MLLEANPGGSSPTARLAARTVVVPAVQQAVWGDGKSLVNVVDVQASLQDSNSTVSCGSPLPLEVIWTGSGNTQSFLRQRFWQHGELIRLVVRDGHKVAIGRLYGSVDEK